MCAVSMVIDWKYDEWNKYIQMPPASPITQAEIDEFRRLLERARKYDKENNQPDCELESKKKRLLDLAKELDVKINFIYA